ncbi:hypothetical protein [Pseudomonas syringae]|uniref:hypothetical protein n=1 Tax=Pseudomonas syringae TaxID=317 RepID=UPI0002D6B931
MFSPVTPDTTTEPVCNQPDQMAELARYVADEMNRNLLHPTVQKLKKRLNHDAAQETWQWMELPWYAQRGAHNNPQTIAASNTAAAMVIWAEKVGQNREWDHKPKILKEFNKNTRHKQGRYAYYYDICRTFTMDTLAWLQGSRRAYFWRVQDLSKSYRKHPEGGVQAREVMNAVLDVPTDQWGDALRLHTCFDEPIQKSKI